MTPKTIARIVACVLFLPTAGMAESRFITVAGEGRAEVVPDMATVTIGVQNRAKSASAAMDLVAGATRKVLDQLTVFGVDDKDIQSTGLSLHPVYERRNNSNQPPEVVGFSASINLSVKLRNLERVGDVLDKLVDAGATGIQGISFSSSDTSVAMDAARTAAIKDAMHRAQIFAEAAQVELGEVIEISSVSGNSGPPQFMRMEAMAVDSVPIAPGTLGLSVQIRIKIALR